ncbi:metallophosphoesterase family protein [Ignicoccus hospitalis]|uniref:Metallophosphoesterase n=1 Tax=Ignicoccus hospitalis (strain KIN4/I / DSM 18386 / JCM 14125) TaxID=453591 RepID=A8ABR7_IGNH4|nr:metallophosphoesterase family protein [Ignicoccus hospitalis]ABU82369.1 metallophosphoesterase [Ignicoccus hospitalis KIN4/I]HIH90844.1 metallophosphoesterase [Desulfurococcaceae archaeon]
MKVLHVSDVHCAAEKLKGVLRREEYDLVVATGDFECLSVVHALEEAKAPVLAVTGNLDDPEIADLLEELGYSVENKVREVNGKRFAGLSGQEPRTSAELLMRLEFDVLLSHYPPKGVVDKAWNGAHIGLVEVRKLVEEKSPEFVHCGHVHEARGWDALGQTLVVNPGPLKWGYYALVDYENKTVDFKRA